VPVQEPPRVRARDVFVKAIFDYEPQGELELRLTTGDVVRFAFARAVSPAQLNSVITGATDRVLEKEDDVWWRGDVNGKIGMFPAPYVEEM
jgi:hypothetical protein